MLRLILKAIGILLLLVIGTTLCSYHGYEETSIIPLPGFLALIRSPGALLYRGPDLGSDDNEVSRLWWNECYLVVETKEEGTQKKTVFLINVKEAVYSELGPKPDLDELARFIGVEKIEMRGLYDAYSQRKSELGYRIHPVSQELLKTMDSMEFLSAEIHFFKSAKRRYPDSLQELHTHLKKQEDLSFTDPWGYEYEYRNKGDDYDLGSRGPVEGGQSLILPDRLKFPGKEWTKVPYSEMIAGAN
ncbi:MAG TPA: hypothetical protein PLA90_02955 [Candidatus Sumerlaeota bacterium]|nr:hypothetical protein [Candidatus Sumerlaeota bacterium]